MVDHIPYLDLQIGEVEITYPNYRPYSVNFVISSNQAHTVSFFSKEDSVWNT